MAILCISDSHGHLDLFYTLWPQIKKLCDDESIFHVLHCGDIGIFDPDKQDQLTAKKRYLLKHHQNPVDQFMPYVKGEKIFPVPVHAILGNHEDFIFAQEIISHQLHIPNFYLHSPGSLQQIPIHGSLLNTLFLGKIIYKRNEPDEN